MNAIKFSHEYYKMPPTVKEQATMLVQVFSCERKQLSEEYVKYDTAYPTMHGIEYYPLPEGRLIILLLTTGNYLWTTIRRHTPEKSEYYRGMVGKAVKIEVGV